MQAFFDQFPLENADWLPVFQQASLQDSLTSILAATTEAILPPADEVFTALNALSPQQTRVLIVGQDPYPTPGDAHGLAFSVQHGKAPRSLKNIFTEIQRDCGGAQRNNANLQDWCEQGVLLLNRALTVAPGAAGSHSRIGWAAVTDALIDTLAQGEQTLAVLLWGGPARKLAPRFAGRANTLVLQSGHPSPLAYNRVAADSFKACGHFKQVNAWLTQQGHSPIDWIGKA